MVNFGERIAYWYLRLQGFLLAENYVLHRSQGIKRTADADLIAIRLRHSRERIGEVDLEGHRDFLHEISASAKHVCVIAQVKTGPTRRVRGAFDTDRLRYCLQFMGPIPEGELDAVLGALAKQPIVLANDWVVAKVLFAEEPDSRLAVNVPLDDAVAFIERRLERHKHQKVPDRLSFPDELMQFLAWRSGRPARESR